MCHPAGAASMLICHHITEINYEILSPFTKHFPHGAAFLAIKILKNRVSENGIRGITFLHAIIITLAETGVEVTDEELACVHCEW